jgi:hypothetical protein
LQVGAADALRRTRRPRSSTAKLFVIYDEKPCRLEDIAMHRIS